MELIFLVVFVLLRIHSRDIIDEVTILEICSEVTRVTTRRLRWMNIECGSLHRSPSPLLDYSVRVKGRKVFAFGQRDAMLANLLLKTEITKIKKSDLVFSTIPDIKRCAYHKHSPGKCSEAKALKLLNGFQQQMYTSNTLPSTASTTPGPARSVSRIIFEEDGSDVMTINYLNSLKEITEKKDAGTSIPSAHHDDAASSEASKGYTHDPPSPSSTANRNDSEPQSATNAGSCPQETLNRQNSNEELFSKCSCNIL